MNIKKTFPILIAAFVILLSACTQTKKDDTSKTGLSVTDTLGLAEFQRFKIESQIRQQMLNEQAVNYAATPAPVQYYTPVKRTSARSYARSSSSRRSSGTRYASNPNRGYSTNDGGYATTRQQPARKKWSHTAKGAVVGGVSGAVIGAVANRRNRLGGGVVGAVIGAATGAGIGAIVDKRQRDRGYYTSYGY